MNRQMKRMQERQERAQKRAGVGRPTAPQATTRRAAVQERGGKRTGVRQFLKEVRLELKQVDWPTRRELFSYTVVVLVTVTVITAFVFGLDTVFTRLVFDVLGN
jgi:preprotein translocase subunit SecE